MANYLVLLTVPEGDLDYLIANEGHIYDYIDAQPPGTNDSEDAENDQTSPEPAPSWFQKLFGKNPEAKVPPRKVMAPPPIPVWWPTEPPDQVEIEINHRNVDLYHWILNGTSEFVDGSGSVFQTWLTTDPSKHSAGEFSKTGIGYYFRPNQLPELLRIVDAVTDDQIKRSYRDWQLQKNKDGEVYDEEVEAFREEFKNLGDALREAIPQSKALIWVTG